MKKLMVVLALACVVGWALAGCAVVPYAGGGGYSSIKGPVATTGKPAGPKVGTAEVVNYAGVYATGDGSIEAAARNGEIQKIHTVDFQMINYGPFYIKTTTIVTGE